MRHFDEFQIRLLNRVKIDRLLTVILLFSISLASISQTAQDPAKAIRDLKEGYLMVRFPAFKSKIDTLNSMLVKAEGKSKSRLTLLRDEAVYERDTVRLDYISAFKNYYDFSDVVYFYDNESKNLQTAHYYNLDDKEISIREISNKPLFYLVFERTQDSKIDAIVIYDREMKQVPPPFPNNFTRGGFNFLFIKASEKSFPEWRVKKINKKFNKFWSQVN
ncbi:MAG TPA: hypothetical protein VMZ69_03505 [Saprospiraceae bacterium]|nr:hypothetical protein [Saprospiraceae bacterium]